MLTGEWSPEIALDNSAAVAGRSSGADTLAGRASYVDAAATIAAVTETCSGESDTSLQHQRFPSGIDASIPLVCLSANCLAS